MSNSGLVDRTRFLAAPVNYFVIHTPLIVWRESGTDQGWVGTAISAPYNRHGQA